MSVKEPYLPLILPPLNVPAKDLPSVGVTSRLLLPSSGKNWLASHDWARHDALHQDRSFMSLPSRSDSGSQLLGRLSSWTQHTTHFNMNAQIYDLNFNGSKVTIADLSYATTALIKVDVCICFSIWSTSHALHGLDCWTPLKCIHPFTTGNLNKLWNLSLTIVRT